MHELLMIWTIILKWRTFFLFKYRSLEVLEELLGNTWVITNAFDERGESKKTIAHNLGQMVMLWLAINWYFFIICQLLICN